MLTIFVRKDSDGEFLSYLMNMGAMNVVFLIRCEVHYSFGMKCLDVCTRKISSLINSSQLLFTPQISCIHTV